MKKLSLMLICLLSISYGVAQQGKDGAANITATSTVNIYTFLTADASTGATNITVASTTGISAGDLIYIIQMQGATVRDSVGEYVNPTNSLPNDTSFGKIKSYNGAGNNEFAEVTSISGNIITIDCALKNSYSDTTYMYPGNTQIIRVPRYTSLTLSGAGQITCPAWNGHTGGVVVIEVQGNTSIGAGTSINVAGMGFRGGAVLNVYAASATNTGSATSSTDGAHKGESIAGDTNVYKKLDYNNIYFNSWSESTPLTTCKGNVANGGGGGNGNNSGGGGGSNGGIISNWNGMGNADVSTANNIAAWNQESATPLNGSFRPTTSSGGGRGGYAFSNTNLDPTSNGPGLTSWTGDDRHNDGGWGGIPLNYSTGSVFLGGGGGAGDSNDGNGTSGGNGGGLVYLLSYGTVTGAGQIMADGAKALNTNWVTTTFDENPAEGDDGAGGGGGGGAIFINSTGNITLTNTLAISAQGGIGGDFFKHNAATNTNFGPGGGGGGGYVATTPSFTAAVNVNGGANGIVAGTAQGSTNTTKIATKFPPNGATTGGIGTVGSTLTPNFYLTASTSSITTCASSAVSLSVTVNGTAPSGLAVEWYTVATGGASIFTGNPYAFTSPATAGTYTYYAGTCPGTYRIPFIVTVTSASGPILTVSATNTTTCAGSSDTLKVSGANTYIWSANTGSAITGTVLVNPTSTTIYTVTGTSTGACAGTGTASISITVNTAPTITVTPTSNTLCSGSSALLTATSSTSSYTWSSNAGGVNTSTVLVSPTSNTTYTVTGANGSCLATQTVTINVTTTPTVSIASSNTIICNGSIATFTASGATLYSWSANAGNATTNTVSLSPLSNGVYTVTGANGNCLNTQTVSLAVDAGPTKADSVSNTASCGLSNGDYVLISVTGGLSPYQVNFNGTGFTNISSFPDSVKNISGNTYTVLIKDAVGCIYTTSVTIGNTSGISKIDSVIANASCVPANSGTITISSITGGTAPYQTNINGGSFATISSLPYSFNNLTAGTYTVQVKDNTNCPHQSIITVGTNGGITSTTITAQPDTCSKQEGVVTITNTVGGVMPFSYALNTAAYQTTSTFTSLAAGIDTVKIKDSNGCVYSTTVVVGSISGPAMASVTIAPDTCNKGVGAITVAGVTGGTMPYSYALNTGAYQSATAFMGLAVGTDTVKIKDHSGCIYSATYTIANTSVVITPSITPSGPTSFCQGGSVTLTSSGNPPYVWSTGATTQTIMVNAGNTTYSVAATSITGCSANSDTIRVTVNPIPSITVVGSSPTVCVGMSTTLAVTSTAIGTSFTWSPSSSLSSSSSGTVTATPSGTTTYVVSGSVSTCSATPATFVLTVNPLPTVSVTPSATVCAGNTATSATLIATGNATSYSWTPATGISATSGSVVTADPSNTTSYVVVGLLNGCPSLPAISIVNTTSVGAFFVATPDTGKAPLYVQFINNSLNATSYAWNFGNGSNQNTTTLTDTAHTTYTNTGTYTVILTASNALGCVSYDTAIVIVSQAYAIIIPNVFSPNGDGVNDDFLVKATGITTLTCDIFDRWGLKLSTFNGVSGYWDGSGKMGKEPDGTYFYVIQATDIKGENHKYNGFITLIR